MILACSPLLNGQTITIRLINGETGKPMKKYNVTLHWVKDFKSSEVFIGPDGLGQVEIVAGATGFTMQSDPKIGKEPGRIAYIDCNQNSTTFIPVQQVLDKGFVPENSCSSKTITSKPGEVIFWGRPRHFWEIDFQ